MISDRLLNQPIQIARRAAGGTDIYGNVVPTFTAPEATTGLITFTQSVERVNDRDVVATYRECFLRAGTVIGPLDRVTFQGQSFEVDGEPERVWNPRKASESHVRARLVTVQGG